MELNEFGLENYCCNYEEELIDDEEDFSRQIVVNGKNKIYK